MGFRYGIEAIFGLGWDIPRDILVANRELGLIR